MAFLQIAIFSREKISFFFFFWDRFHCVVALAVQELTVNQAGLILMDSCCLCLPRAGLKMGATSAWLKISFLHALRLRWKRVAGIGIIQPWAAWMLMACRILHFNGDLIRLRSVMLLETAWFFFSPCTWEEFWWLYLLFWLLWRATEPAVSQFLLLSFLRHNEGNLTVWSCT